MKLLVGEVCISSEGRPQKTPKQLGPRNTPCALEAANIQRTGIPWLGILQSGKISATHKMLQMSAVIASDI
jgi:hypothetical protein